MRTFKLSLLLALPLLPPARAQEAQFFRVSGPVRTTITAFHLDGTLVWTSAATNATFTVQTTSSLLGGSNWVDYVQVPATNPITSHRILDRNPPAGMSLIPAGSFTMGDTFAEGWEVPTHSVYLSAFYMDKYAVTKAMWDEVYQWGTNHGYSFSAGSGKAANHPAQTLTWYDAVKWCNARSEKEEKTPAYYTDAPQTLVYRSGQVTNTSVNWNSGYRLPTEAEWEKAARGGLSGKRFPWGDTISHSQANYYANPLSLSPGGYAYDVNSTNGYHPTFFTGGSPYTSPVGYFAPNGYGLYDMEGNVFVWCWDWYGGYSGDSQVDPHGPASGLDRVIRGGSFVSPAINCRTVYRTRSSDPASKSTNIGFRSALPAGQ